MTATFAGLGRVTARFAAGEAVSGAAITGPGQAESAR